MASRRQQSPDDGLGCFVLLALFCLFVGGWISYGIGPAIFGTGAFAGLVVVMWMAILYSAVKRRW